MIQFFEFLNSCSPLRATGYMIFILLIMFFTYSFIESLFNVIFKKNCDDETSEEAEDYYSGVADDEEKKE